MTLYESNRNKRAQTRDSLSQYLNKISISSMDSVRMQLGMLSMITSQTNELSRRTQVKSHLKNLLIKNNFQKLFF